LNVTPSAVRAPAPAHVLPVIVLAQLLGTSPWFAVNAVMPDLQRQLGWKADAVGTLSAALQAGFIAGTLVFALLALADRWPARRVFAACALLAAACTLAAAAAASSGSWQALLAWRVLTGFFMAGIYPVGMKIAAQWFPQGLGAALGWLVGALVLGSASPHALRALGAGWPWVSVFIGVAIAAAAAGALMLLALPPSASWPTPSPAQAPVLQFAALGAAWRNWRVRASMLGYFGHMVELYTLWVLVPLILATRMADAVQLSWAAFAVLGAGAVGCVGGGALVRHWGSARVAAVQLAASGACCLLAPWMLAAPLALFMAWMVVWGLSAAGDSPQFSALTAANAAPASVGSVLTLSTCIGFAISALSIALFVYLAQAVAWAQLLPWLALGPLLGLLGLWPLLRSAD
jgi:MFS transporter, DHA1 family, inner membrane transport protein